MICIERAWAGNEDPAEFKTGQCVIKRDGDPAILVDIDITGCCTLWNVYDDDGRIEMSSIALLSHNETGSAACKACPFWRDAHCVV